MGDSVQKIGGNNIFIQVLLLQQDVCHGIPFWIFKTTQEGLNILENRIKGLKGLDEYNTIFNHVFEEAETLYVDEMIYQFEDLAEANLEISKTFDLTETFEYIINNPHLI